MADKYDSIYTGAEIDQAVGKAGKLPTGYGAESGGKMLLVDSETGDLTLEGLYQFNRRLRIECRVLNGEIELINSPIISTEMYGALCTGVYYVQCDFINNDDLLVGSTSIMELRGEIPSMGALFYGKYVDPVTLSGAKPFVCVISAFGSSHQPMLNWLPDEPFIVTCTPTAQDYSGTMDKTVDEIDAAYKAGQKIVFRVVMSATEYMDVDCTARYKGSLAYPSFNGYAVITTLITGLIYAWTGATSDGTKNTYSTHIYPLTPMS